MGIKSFANFVIFLFLVLCNQRAYPGHIYGVFMKSLGYSGFPGWQGTLFFTLNIFLE
jgi:hypothetical protein